MESYLAERHVLWKEIRNGGYIVRTVGMYLGLACILRVIITKVPLVFFVYVKGFFCVHAKSRIEVCIMECCTLHSREFKLQ